VRGWWYHKADTNPSSIAKSGQTVVWHGHAWMKEERRHHSASFSNTSPATALLIVDERMLGFGLAFVPFCLNFSLCLDSAAGVAAGGWK
jgi:hypothetical protein